MKINVYQITGGWIRGECKLILRWSQRWLELYNVEFALFVDSAIDPSILDDQNIWAEMHVY